MTTLFAIWPMPPKVRSWNCCLPTAWVSAIRKFLFWVADLPLAVHMMAATFVAASAWQLLKS